MTWSPAKDDFYVADYEVYRGTTASNLTLIAGMNASTLTFTDSNVTSGRTYYYAIAAVDEAGNISALQTPVAIVAFPDTVPPSTPANLVGNPDSDIQISFTWSPSTDNIAVYGYEIYCGISASDTAPAGTSSSTSFSLHTAPAQTYYCQVDAYDASGNHSAKSDAVAVTSLPDTTPPTAPAALSAIASSGSVTLTWSASTDDFWMGSYEIYRGTDPANLNLYEGQLATSLTDTDTRVSSGNTYYYAVAGVDIAGNVSALSPVASATLP
jgi:fibronectin type 3 domain-containing protein